MCYQISVNKDVCISHLNIWLYSLVINPQQFWSAAMQLWHFVRYANWLKLCAHMTDRHVAGTCLIIRSCCCCKDALMKRTKNCALWYYEYGNGHSWNYLTKLCLPPAVSKDFRRRVFCDNLFIFSGELYENMYIVIVFFSSYFYKVIFHTKLILIDCKFAPFSWFCLES